MNVCFGKFDFGRGRPVGEFQFFDELALSCRSTARLVDPTAVLCKERVEIGGIIGHEQQTIRGVGVGAV